MRHLLRCLILAAVVLPALASVSSAQPSRLEACVDGNGHCSITGDQCATRGQCPNPPAGQTCICD